MRFAIVIPARFESVRFPGKPLTPLIGATGLAKSLIVRCVEAAQALPGAARIIVATDHQRIAEEAEKAGAEIAMTSPACRNGTERVAEAAATLGLDVDVVVNLQGDAPLTPPWFLDAVLAAMGEPDGPQMATPILPFEPAALERVERDLAAGRKGPTAAVAAQNGDALYFSKQIIPYHKVGDGETAPLIHHHFGLYAYTPRALAAYAATEPTPLELIEGLEQLRFLETGMAVRVVEVDARGHALWEVNHPDDVPLVEAGLAAMGIV